MRNVIIVMLGAFIAQTTEYLPIGLLPEISQSFSVSQSAVGILVTGYAWLAAATAIPLTLVSSRFHRERLFFGLLTIISLANILAALAPNYVLLALARVVVALTHGVFWSILASFALSVAPGMQPGRALAWAFGGISLANVLGVPMAAAIGNWVGWRMAFGIFAGLGLAVIAAGNLWLSNIRMRKDDAITCFPRGNVRLYQASLVTVLIVAGHFCGYTYIVPLLKQVAQVASDDIPSLLFIFGLAGAIGTLLAGWAGKRPAILAFLATIGIMGSQALMVIGPPSLPLVWIEVTVWGASIAVLIIGLQGWVIELSPQQPDAASALYVAAFNFGIGSGAMIGAFAQKSFGEPSILWSGIVLAASACAAFAIRMIPSNRV